MIKKPEDILKQYWGYDKFRTLQPEIIQDIISGKDVLALLPTGGGKSICFQVPALCMPGICIVVSPLVALMNDQIKNLAERGVKSLAVHSNLSRREIDVNLDKAIYEDYKLLYLSPERLQTSLFLERFKKMNVSFLAVDEAHCISQWGYDFRPPYLKINELRTLRGGDFSIAALTATATPRVVKDIQDKLGFKQYNVKQKSFKRDNLAYIVLNTEDKDNKMLRILKRIDGPSIVYSNTRRGTKSLSDYLQRSGFTSTFYHAGLEAETKEKHANLWFSGNKRVICATNAFGMGIDKPDVRLVVNYTVSASLEAYFQEAGRAGRDGEKAYAILLWHKEDIESLKQKFTVQFPPLEFIGEVYDALAQQITLAINEDTDKAKPYEIDLIAEKLNCKVIEVYHALKILEYSGLIVLQDEPMPSSTLKIVLNKADAYNLQLKTNIYGKVLEVLLRSYPGLFEVNVKIREQHIANRLQISFDAVSSILTEMHKKNIIFYEPKDEKPRVSFPLPRRKKESLNLSKESYEFRKQIYLEMLHAVEGYVSEQQCRSVALLTYFGEENAEKCGVCDVCIEEKKQAENQQIISVAEDICARYSTKKLKIDDIFSAYSTYEEEFILKSIRYLQEKKLASNSSNSHIEFK
ncbi:MAG: RecQ family ATP-dependent DNA helicase [Luteibaculaceae bacterium]